MYIIKSKNGKNIHIKDLGIRLIGTDQIGVKVNEYILEHSQDIHLLKDDLIIESDGINKTGTKNIVSSIEELENLPDLFPGETAILIQKDEEGNVLTAAEYLWDYSNQLWIPLSGGGEGGAPPYIHPSTHPSTMITESDEKQFVSKQQKENWDAKVDKTYVDGAISLKVDKTYVDTELAKKVNENEVYSIEEVDNLISNIDIPNVDEKADKTYVDSKLSEKADITSVYTKLDSDSKFSLKTEMNLKANISDVYNKQEIDEKFDGFTGGEGGLVPHDHNDLYYQKTEVYNKSEIDNKISNSGSIVTDSTLNGNILVDGNEVVVYEHPQKHNISEIDGLHTVASTGSYNDLKDKPVIPPAYDDTELKAKISYLESELAKVLERLTALENANPPSPDDKLSFEFILPNAVARYDLDLDEKWVSEGHTLTLENVFGPNFDGVGNTHELRWYGYDGNIEHPEGLVVPRTGIDQYEVKDPIIPDIAWTYDDTTGVITFEGASPSDKVYRIVEI